MADYYVFRSDAEWKGHADIALEPLVARYPHLQRGYLIELKYRARSESADQAAVTTVVEERGRSSCAIWRTSGWRGSFRRSASSA